MNKTIFFSVAGFSIAVIAGFIVGKETRSAATNNVKASMSGSTVVIKADLKQIAKQSLTASRSTIVDSLKSYFK